MEIEMWMLFLEEQNADITAEVKTLQEISTDEREGGGNWDGRPHGAYNYGHQKVHRNERRGADIS